MSEKDKEKKKEINHSQRAHSVLGASSAKRWMNCPGSVALIEQAPKPATSEAALEGTAAHELAELSLVKGQLPTQFIGQVVDGYEVTEEMAAAVQVYYDYVTGVQRKTKGDMFIEQRFSLPTLHPAFFGTNDAGIVDRLNKTLYVIDYKHGMGTPVSPVKNPQLMYYGLGLVYALRWKPETVVLTVVQPRCEGEDAVKESVIPYSELAAFAGELKKAAARTEKKNAPLANGDWCKFCAAKPICPKLHAVAQEEAMVTFEDSSLPEISKLTNEQIARVVSKKKEVESFLKACEEYALNKILDGQEMPGLKIIKGRGRRFWNDTKELKKRYGKEVLKPESFISPSQFEKMFGKKVEYKDLVSTKEGALKVAPEDAKGKPVQVSQAPSFNKITNNKGEE